MIKNKIKQNKLKKEININQKKQNNNNNNKNKTNNKQYKKKIKKKFSTFVLKNILILIFLILTLNTSQAVESNFLYEQEENTKIISEIEKINNYSSLEKIYAEIFSKKTNLLKNKELNNKTNTEQNYTKIIFKYNSELEFYDKAYINLSKNLINKLNLNYKEYENISLRFFIQNSQNEFIENIKKNINLKSEINSLIEIPISLFFESKKDGPYWISLIEISYENYNKSNYNKTNKSIILDNIYQEKIFSENINIYNMKRSNLAYLVIENLLINNQTKEVSFILYNKGEKPALFFENIIEFENSKINFFVDYINPKEKKSFNFSLNNFSHLQDIKLDIYNKNFQYDFNSYYYAELVSKHNNNNNSNQSNSNKNTNNKNNQSTNSNDNSNGNIDIYTSNSDTKIKNNNGGISKNLNNKNIDNENNKENMNNVNNINSNINNLKNTKSNNIIEQSYKNKNKEIKTNNILNSKNYFNNLKIKKLNTNILKNQHLFSNNHLLFDIKNKHRFFFFYSKLDYIAINLSS